MEKQKVVLVVGASSGLGEGLCRALVARGHRVWAAARRTDRMAALGQGGARLLGLDVTDEVSVRAGIAQVLGEEGRIDVLVCNAGYGAYAMVEALPLAEARRQFEVNLFGVARLVQEVLPSMRQRRSGRIVVTSSLVAHVSTLAIGWYAASKHALRALVDGLRQEVAPLGISVAMVEPGLVRTGFDTVALDHLDQVPHPADYQPAVEAFRQAVAAQYARSPGPERSVRALTAACLASRPRIRYRASWESWAYPLVRAWVGDRIFDRVLRRAYGPRLS